MKDFLITLKPHLVSILIIVALALYLVVRWLPAGYIIAGGDVGIPNLFPQKQLYDVTSSWWDSHGTGVSSPTTYTSISYYLFLSFLDSVGITPDLTQKIVFFLIIAGGAISIYFLAITFDYNRRTSFLASLFFIFNLTALSVWQRGVHNAMLMLLLAPLSLLILVRGVKENKYSSIIFINVVSILLSYVFGALGYVFSLWLLWSIFLVIILVSEWTDKTRRRFVFQYFILLFISWILTNAFWIIHLLKSSGYVLGQFSGDELRARGSDVLVGLRPYLGAETILRGISRYYHYYIRDWGNIYSNPFFIILSWIPTLIIFFTALVKENYKSLTWKFLIILAVIVLIISKGVNAPFGILNKIPYDLSSFLAPLRNPYEKVGIILIIPYSLLFALGTSQILGLLKLRRMHFLTPVFMLIVVSCLTVLVWPLWFGKLFVSDDKRYAVSIPSYYNEANNWLKEKIAVDDTRILHLPLAWGESVDYDWEYTGIEPSQYFFNGSSIGYQLGVGGVDTRIRDLLLNVHEQDTNNIQKSLASLNIGWVVIHNETLYRARILESPERINKWLSTKPDFLEYAIDFGPLSVWKVKDQYRAGHIYTTQKLNYFAKTKAGQALNIWNEIETVNDGFVADIKGSDSDLLKKLVSKNVIFPARSITYSPLSPINEELGLKNMATVSFLPDSLLYPLMSFKEYLIVAVNQINSTTCFLQSGKRLKEAALLSRQNKFTKTNEALRRYLDQLNECSKISNDVVMADLGPMQREFILGQLVIQKAVLETEFNQPQVSQAGDTTRRRLIEYMSELGIIPRFNPQKPNNNKQWVILSYGVPQEGNFTIKLLKPGQDLIKLPPKIVQIDDSLVDLIPVEVSERYIKYPPYNFRAGFHEIQLETEPLSNLLNAQVQFKKDSSAAGFIVETDPVTQKPTFSGRAVTGPISLTLDLPHVKVGRDYELSFDVLLGQGASPFLTITHDSDPLDKNGYQIPAVKTEIAFDSYSIDWKNVRVKYSPTLNANSARIAFNIIPWNDCFASFSFEQCYSFGMVSKADRPSEAGFKNISLTQSFKFDLVLEQTNENVLQLGRTDIGWKKISPTLYEVNLSNQSFPYLLTFSETYHELWKILDTNGKIINLPHFSVNGFANGWLVEKPLPDKVRIKFVLQDFRDKGIAISVISLLLLVSIAIYLDYKRRPSG